MLWNSILIKIIKIQKEKDKKNLAWIWVY